MMRGVRVLPLVLALLGQVPEPVLAQVARPPGTRTLPQIPPGGLDVSFGDRGRLELNLGFFGGMALQPDGKAVLCGLVGWPQFHSDLELVRIDHRGAFDSTYGRGGTALVVTGFQINICNAVAVQPDGKAIVAGRAENGEMMAVRVDTEGNLDWSSTPLSGLPYSEATQVVLQPDGKILLIGFLFGSYYRDVAVVRLRPDGFLDPTFGEKGLVRVHIDNSNEGWDAALLEDGRILVVGSTGSSTLDRDFVVVRLTTEGKLDPTFGSFGIVRTDFGSSDEAAGVAVLPDGGAVVVGRTAFAGGDLAIARYDLGGRLVRGFGEGGKMVIDFGGDDTAADLVLEAYGRFIVAGSSRVPVWEDRFAIARLWGNGDLDTSFGTAGRVITDFPGGGSGQVAILQPDGRLLVAGTGASGTALARYITADLCCTEPFEIGPDCLILCPVIPTLSTASILLMIVALAGTALTVLSFQSR